MKNGNFKLIGGLLAGMLIGGVTVVGASQAIQALQNTEIKVSLNGQIQEFKDETTGETQYPITYHDRTYLPLPRPGVNRRCSHSRYRCSAVRFG